MVATWPACRRVRIGILDANAAWALPFWSSLGFVANGESRPHRVGTVDSTIRVYVKPLERRVVS